MAEALPLPEVKPVISEAPIGLPVEQVSSIEQLVEATPYKQLAVQALRSASWYQERLQAISFNLKDIRSHHELIDILQNYGRHCFAQQEQPDALKLDQQILRLELRDLTIDCNKYLAHEVQSRFPGHYNYTHRRSCPDNQPAYLQQDKLHVLRYTDDVAIRIVNSVGVNALFHKSSHGVKYKIVKQSLETNQGCASNKVHNLSLYDLLPNQFLISRIWMIRKLCDKLAEQSEMSLLQTIQYFEQLNRHARFTLCYPDHQQPNVDLYWPHYSYLMLHMTEASHIKEAAELPLLKRHQAFLETNE